MNPIKGGPKYHAKALARAAGAQAKAKYLLRLYVSDATPRAQLAIRSVTEICEQHLKDRYELQIVDIYEHPDALKKEQLVVVPTLVKRRPYPQRRLIGDMANKEKVLVGLDLRPRG